MSLVTLRTLLDHAQKNEYAIPAFNINFLEQAAAVIDAAIEANSPAIIQLSSGGVNYAPQWFYRGLYAYAKQAPTPVCIHRDHTYEYAEFLEALNSGLFTSIMIDGSITKSGLPRSFNENVKITQSAIKLAQEKGISIEGELGCLGALDSGASGEEDGHKASRLLTQSELLTDPEEARLFVQKTKVDALAVAIGTSHGAYKFSKPPTEQLLSIAQVKKIHAAIPEQHLVLHGCSSVDTATLKSINHHGGQIKETYGVPVASICEAIPFGVRKVNIDTDLRLACTEKIRKYLCQNPEQFDPRNYLAASQEAMQKLCVDRYLSFGSQGQAQNIMSQLDEAITA